MNDVELDPNESAVVFKSMLYSLTNVPVEKQKVMISGKLVKDDTDLKTLKLKEGM